MLNSQFENWRFDAAGSAALTNIREPICPFHFNDPVASLLYPRVSQPHHFQKDFQFRIKTSGIEFELLLINYRSTNRLIVCRNTIAFLASLLSMRSTYKGAVLCSHSMPSKERESITQSGAFNNRKRARLLG